MAPRDGRAGSGVRHGGDTTRRHDAPPHIDDTARAPGPCRALANSPDRRAIVASVDEQALERETFAVGKRLAEALPGRSRSPLKVLDDKAMDFASSDQELKAALFRFVDVVPACRNLDDLAAHLTSFLREVSEPPPSIAMAMRMGTSKAGRKAIGAAAATGVKHMAHRFIVGESPAQALPVLRDLWQSGVASTVDLLGEATVTQAEAQRYADRCA